MRSSGRLSGRDTSHRSANIIRCLTRSVMRFSGGGGPDLGPANQPRERTAAEGAGPNTAAPVMAAGLHSVRVYGSLPLWTQ